MSIKIFTAKYVVDRRRNEPRNVGVLVVGEDGRSASRFLGQTDDGSVKGNRLPRSLIADLEAYKLWVRHWTESVERQDAEQSLVTSNRASYYVEEAGEILMDPQLENVDALADRYFADLVGERRPSKTDASAASTLISAVDRIVSAPQVTELVEEVKRNYEVSIELDRRIVNLPFQYAFRNGKVTVGQRILLSDELHAFSSLGKFRSLPTDHPRPVAFVLHEEFANLRDDADVYWLLDAHSSVIQADLDSAPQDLAEAIRQS